MSSHLLGHEAFLLKERLGHRLSGMAKQKWSPKRVCFAAVRTRFQQLRLTGIHGVGKLIAQLDFSI